MSGIQYCGMTWNPIVGCWQVSPGCANCYAIFAAKRVFEQMSGAAAKRKDGGTARQLATIKAYGRALKHDEAGNVEAAWSGKLGLNEDKLEDPLRNKKPTVYFMSMTDLFHESLSNTEIAAVYGVMANAKHHVFQILTKRSERMVEWYQWAESHLDENGGFFPATFTGKREWGVSGIELEAVTSVPEWPLPNVWPGVSAENQRMADVRVGELKRIKAAVRWISVEPMLDSVLFDADGIHWVVIGGESGPNARPFDIDKAFKTVRRLRDDRVPVYVKQMGDNPVRTLHGSQRKIVCRAPKGGKMSEWPAELRIRDFPIGWEDRLNGIEVG